jgi:hypothetical protein
MTPSETNALRTKELEKENTPLRLVAEQAEDISIPREVSNQTSNPRTRPSRYRARAAKAKGLKASGLLSDRPTQIDAALREPQGPKGSAPTASVILDTLMLPI